MPKSRRRCKLMVTCCLCVVFPFHSQCNHISEDRGKRELTQLGVERQLTFGKGPDQCPAWSPDGKSIAFHSARAGNFDIWIVAAEGGTPKQLTRSPLDEGFPSWSPDGKRLAFVRFVEGARKGRGNLVVMKANGTSQLELTKDGTVKFGVRWHPTGKTLVFAELSGQPEKFSVAIWELSLVTGARKKLIDGYAGGLSFNPKGTLLALDSFDEKAMQRRLYVMDLQEKTVKPLVVNMNKPWFPDWSPTGKWIAFHLGEGGKDGIWMIRPNGSERTKLIQSARGDRYPCWSPDGRQIAFVRAKDEEAHVWIFGFKTKP